MILLQKYSANKEICAICKICEIKNIKQKSLFITIP
jgi:hypothetical protein